MKTYYSFSTFTQIDHKQSIDNYSMPDEGIHIILQNIAVKWK